MNENKKPCPQFPYWGARYPDACCVDGKLYDLDRGDWDIYEEALEEGIKEALRIMGVIK